MEPKVYDLEERLTVFAANIVIYVDRIPTTLAGRYYAGQLLRSGGSPALHYGEAQAAESHADFIHKNKIALKELKESRVNLRVQAISKMMPTTDADLLWLTQEVNELVNIIGKIISNTKKNQASR